MKRVVLIQFLIVTLSLGLFFLLSSKSNPDSLMPGEILNSIGIRLIFIPPGKGEFKNGKMKLKNEIDHGFYMGQTEVTQAQWARIMKNHSKKEFKTPSQSRVCEECAVDSMSFEAMMEFLNRLNQREGCHLTQKQVIQKLKEGLFQEISGCYRIPFEEEWSYSCMAGEKSYLYGTKGLKEETLHDYGWFLFNSFSLVMPVARKKPNELGLHDMIGNVREFVFKPLNRFERTSKNYFMGGSIRDSGRTALCYSRKRYDSNKRRDSQGFRILRQP